MTVLLGCIADDFTGATDLASMLVRHGMATVQLIGVPADGVDPGDAQAVVVALKSAPSSPIRRSASRSRRSRGCARGRPADPVQVLLDLRFHRARQHRSRERGAARGARRRFHDRLPGAPGKRSINLPRPPVRRRQLLSDSHMRHHPLTPMTDSNLVRVLQRRRTRRRSGWCRTRGRARPGGDPGAL